MADVVDELQIDINAKATKANDAIDRLVGKLDRLATSLSRVNGTNLNGLANGVQRLGNAMQVMNTIKTADFTRLATNLTKLGTVNTSALNSASISMSHLARAMSAFSGTSFDNKNMQNLINSITRLSNANVGSLASADFSRLGISINQLATSLSNAPKIQQSVISMTNAIANLAKSGQNIPIVSASLGSLGSSLNKFILSISSAPVISENTIAFSHAIASLANAGAKAGVTASNLSALGVWLKNLMATLSRSPRVSQNVIQMTNALANLASQGSKVGSASNSIVRGLNRTSASANTARRSFGGLASAIGKFYATYFMLIRAFGKVKDSIKATADYLESYNYFDVALGKIGQDWKSDYEKYGFENADEYANSFSSRLTERMSKLSGIKLDIGADGKGLLSDTGVKNLGLNLQEVTQYAAQLASVTNSVGQTGEVSLAAADAFTKLGADMSSLFNMDYSQVMNNLQSALIGQSRSVYKYGIDITNATLQQYAYNLGIEKAVKDMTQAEKMQLRMIAILDQSKVSWGDQANTINSISNQFRQFKNNIKEAGILFGQLFVPLLERTMPIVNGVTIALKRLMATIAGLFGIELDLSDFSKGYTDIETGVGDMGDSMDDATESAKKLKNQLLGIDELNVLSKQEDENTNISDGDEVDLSKEIIDATDSFNKAWNEAYKNMQVKSQELADRFSGMFSPITDVINSMVDNDFTGAGKTLGELITAILTIDDPSFLERCGFAINTFLTFIFEAVKGIDYEKILDGLHDGLMAFLGGLFGFVSDDNSKIYSLAYAIEAVISAFFIKKGIDLTLSAITKGFSGFWNSIKNMSASTISTLASALIGLSIAVSNYISDKKEQAQIVEYGTSLGILSNKLKEIHDRILEGKENVDTAGVGEIQYIKDLTTAYFDLKGKENLTAAEAKHLDNIYNELKEKLPGFAGIVNDTTLSYDKQKEAVAELTEELAKQYKMQAAESLLVDAYKDLYTLKKNAEDAKKIYEDAGDALWNFKQKYDASNLLDVFERNVYDTYIGGYTKEFEEAKEVYKGYVDEIATVEAEINDLMSILGLVPDEKIEGNVNKALGTFTKSMRDGYNGVMFKEAKKIGEKIAQDQSSGYLSQEKKVSNTIVSSARNAIKSASADVTRYGNELGSQLGNGIASGISSVKGNIQSAIQGMLGEVQTSVNNVSKGSLLVPLYASGGFPEDGWFRASKGEYFGSFDDGTSYIANNIQIVSGVASGVRDANAEQNVLLREQNALLRKLLDKDVSVNIGDRDIARANERGKRSMGYTLIT